MEIKKNDYSFVERFDFIFNNIIINNKINQIINDEIKPLATKKYNISNKKITYFKSFFPQLNGFAGINEIYINITALDDFYSVLRESKSREESIKFYSINRKRDCPSVIKAYVKWLQRFNYVTQ